MQQKTSQQHFFLAEWFTCTHERTRDVHSSPAVAISRTTNYGSSSERGVQGRWLPWRSRRSQQQQQQQQCPSYCRRSGLYRSFLIVVLMFFLWSRFMCTWNFRNLKFLKFEIRIILGKQPRCRIFCFLYVVSPLWFVTFSYSKVQIFRGSLKSAEKARNVRGARLLRVKDELATLHKRHPERSTYNSTHRRTVLMGRPPFFILVIAVVLFSLSHTHQLLLQNVLHELLALLPKGASLPLRCFSFSRLAACFATEHPCKKKYLSRESLPRDPAFPEVALDLSRLTSWLICCSC